MGFGIEGKWGRFWEKFQIQGPIAPGADIERWVSWDDIGDRDRDRTARGDLGKLAR
jgi:hypothetical protein